MTLVYNPFAGDERHEGEHLLERLEEAGHDARLVSGRKKLARQLEDPGELVAVAGGDGIVKEVAVALAGRRVPMAILPLGTAAWSPATSTSGRTSCLEKRSPCFRAG